MFFSSPYAIPMYAKMGFVETDSMQTSHGIKYMPMIRKICSVDFLNIEKISQNH